MDVMNESWQQQRMQQAQRPFLLGVVSERGCGCVVEAASMFQYHFRG